MSLSIWLYLVDVVSNINCIGSAWLILSSVGVGLFGFISMLEYMSAWNDKEKERYVKIWKLIYKKLWIQILVIFMMIVTPDKKTMYLILGSSYLEQTGLPSKVVEALNIKLDDVIDDLKKKDKKD